MIGQGMERRGHEVQYWSSPAVASLMPVPNSSLRKWLGYADQFLLYPSILSRRVSAMPADTLFVVTDHALGPWVPRIAHRPHVIHCHDFLAQRSALGEVPENPTSWTGQQYQALIRRGFRYGKHFISVSHRSQHDLHRFLTGKPVTSEVVHNGLNGDFGMMAESDAKTVLADQLTPSDANGFLLHVGGNQWYKNRLGVVKLYKAWCEITDNPLPLWMVGAEPMTQLRDAASEGIKNGNVRFLTGLDDGQVTAAYNLAKLFLFPSLDEGFGWPIAEAMACGTPVLTTDAAPMTEVGSKATVYFRRRTTNDANWAQDGARLIEQILNWPAEEREARIHMGLERASELFA